MAMKVGFIGLGMIGGPMAEQLAEPPFELTVHDAFPAAMARFKGKAHLAASPAELGKRADLVGICVLNDAQVQAVVAGPGGLLETMQKGGVIAVHSTVRSTTVRELAELAAAKGVDLIDAAVSGGPMGAKARNLVCMVGGSAEAIERARPLLKAYCGNIIHAGGTGAGLALKVSNNLVTYIELMSALEGYRLAEALGLDPDMLTSVMKDNGNLTTAMGLYMKYRRDLPGQMGAAGFRKTQLDLANLGEKDLDLALEMAAQFGVRLPTTEAVRKLMRDNILIGLPE
jgi:3-hydroxyisobutyrate dehydrogenase-like beta-hydroxyacid dehydrogenase